MGCGSSVEVKEGNMVGKGAPKTPVTANSPHIKTPTNQNSPSKNNPNNNHNQHNNNNNIQNNNNNNNVNNNNNNNAKAGRMTSGTTILDDLGGPDIVARVSRRVYARFADDPDLAPFFARVDGERLTRRQQEYTCHLLSGGELPYSGLSMRRAHRGLGVSYTHFARMMRFTGEALEEVLVGECGWSKANSDAMIVKVLGAFREIRPDIVEIT